MENPHILYTDDDEDDILFFRDALAEIDDRLVLTTASDGDEMLQKLQSHALVPRIIFLDLNMPRKDGFEVLRAMREDESLKHYPIVMFSTTKDPNAIIKTRELGANIFVSKPNSFNDMKEAIRTCLDIDWGVFATGDDNYMMRLR